MKVCKVYNVYEGKRLIMEHVPTDIIHKYFNTNVPLHKYIKCNEPYLGRYRFVEISRSEQDERFWREWDNTISLFKNVKWVQHGGKRLEIKHE